MGPISKRVFTVTLLYFDKHPYTADWLWESDNLWLISCLELVASRFESHAEVSSAITLMVTRRVLEAEAHRSRKTLQI